MSILLERTQTLQDRSVHTFYAPAYFAEDALVQRYEQWFKPLDGSCFERQSDAKRRGRLPHPLKAYVQAFRVMVAEELAYVSDLRTYLCEHPALVW